MDGEGRKNEIQSGKRLRKCWNIWVTRFALLRKSNEKGGEKLVGKKLESANLEIMEQLRRAVNEATNRGDYLPVAIYIFQMLEGTLRMHINWLAREKNVSEENIKRISEDEIVFPRLVLYFDVLKPNNGLSERLLNLNKKRNSIIHRLFFDFESLDSLKDFLKDFCQEGIELYESLGSLAKYQNSLRGN